MWEKVYALLDNLGITSRFNIDDYLFSITFKTSTAIRGTHCVIYYIDFTVIAQSV